MHKNLLKVKKILSRTTNAMRHDLLLLQEIHAMVQQQKEFCVRKNMCAVNKTKRK